jgi:hypothetical protein
MAGPGFALLGWIAHKLTPEVLAPLPEGPLRPPGEPLFTADFSSKEQWVAGRSWAYPGGGPVNPGDGKLDHLVPDPDHCRDGVLRATRRLDGTWNAGLLTTEGSADGFTVRTGDILEARVRLPVEQGAWPAIWTWRDGGNEIDVFEYHPDNPDVLELSNHVRGGGCYYTDPTIRPGAWVDLRVEFWAESVIWWVNGKHAFADDTGVGRDWSAYLIVNLSVCAGAHHPAPESSASEMSYEVSHLRVFRP